MKKFFSVFMLLLIAVMAIGQIVDSVVVTTGGTPQSFLERNGWTLAFIAFTVLSEWLGSTGYVKEGSIYAWILNMIEKIIRGKANVIKTKKAEFMEQEDLKKVAKSKGLQFMKVLLLGVFLSGMAMTASAQSKWDGFFKPVNHDLFSQQVKAPGAKAASVWMFRPTVEVSAVQLMYDKPTKNWVSSSFKSAGVGVSYQHFTEANEVPFSDFGINALMLFDATPTETTNAAVSFAATVSALQYINVGGGYNLGIDKWFILAGVTINFNK